MGIKSCQITSATQFDQDQVNMAKSYAELIEVLTRTFIHQYPIISVQMWTLNDEQPEGVDFYQHYQKKVIILCSMRICRN